MQWVTLDEVGSWYRRSRRLSEFAHTVGCDPIDQDYLEGMLGFPLHLELVVRRLAAERGEVAADALDSIPFYSLCRGLWLPLSGMLPERAAQLFGLSIEEPPDSARRAGLLQTFMTSKIGLSVTQKVACLLGDPFEGRRSTMRRDSLLRLLLSMRLVPARDLVDRLAVVGDVAVLFAEHAGALRREPPLTAAEVMQALRLLPGEPRSQRFELLRSLVARCGSVEAYFLAKLLLRKAGFGFQYEGRLLAELIAGVFGADPDRVAHAMALTDPFNVVRVLEQEGETGLNAIVLQPLVAVRPALASGATDEIAAFPVWIERKYDGVRLMLHKSTDRLGSVLCGAYSRNRGDFLESIPGLDATIRLLPFHNAIIDGELFGTVVDLDGARPATVYEVFGALQGDGARPVKLKYAAFDLLYADGQDLTALPLSQRRQRLVSSLGTWGAAAMPLPVPISVAEGQLAQSKDDINRLYQHFRAQGYEGVIAKDLGAPYLIATRDPAWRKRKPEVTLDLVLLGAVYAVTTKDKGHVFGSYVIGARSPEGGFVDVGDVAGVDRVRDAEICGLIMREGLATGRRIERASASGVRPGIELAPHIVVTVRFEGVIRETSTGELSLRDPKLVVIRSDKAASEADSARDLEELYLRQRIG
jgi:DNA ligase-1